MYTHENDNALASSAIIIFYFLSSLFRFLFPIAETVIAVSFSMKGAPIKPS